MKNTEKRTLYRSEMPPQMLDFALEALAMLAPDKEVRREQWYSWSNLVPHEFSEQQNRYGTKEIGCELLERTDFDEQAYHTNETKTVTVKAYGLPPGVNLNLQYAGQRLTLQVSALNAKEVAKSFEKRFA